VTAVTARARMICEEVEPLLSPCVDGELLEEDRAAVRAHVLGCPACRRRLTELQRVKAALQLAGHQVELPPELQSRLEADIAAEVRRLRGRRAAGAAAVLAGLAACAALVVLGLSPAAAPLAGQGAAALEEPPPSGPVVAEVAERHQLELPVDVASPDPRRVQDFLSARVGHAVVVPRLDQLGWGLQGGRVVDVDHRRGAQLVYTGGYGQRLSVVVLPDPDGALRARILPPIAPPVGSPLEHAAALQGRGEARRALQAVAKNGLRVRVVSRGDSVYSFVSDVDDDRLATLSGALER
jgi:anti-sigma factor RsiW